MGRAADRGINRQGGKGARSCSGRVAGAAQTGSEPRCELGDPYDLGAEFFRWEFATAVAGSILGINAFNQPDVQSAKDRTNQILGAGGDPDVAPTGSLDELLDGAEERNYICVQAFVDPTDENEAQDHGARQTHPRPHGLRDDARLRAALPALDRSAAQGRAADRPLRPDRRRHGDEIAIPGKDFGFGKLIRAQAAGDFASLQERGRPIVRIGLEDL